MTHSPTSPLFLLASLITRPLDPPRVSDSSWGEMVEIAVRHGLGPMLLWSLTHSGAAWAARLDLKALTDAARAEAVRWILFDRSQIEINAALWGATIPALWLKGAALARTVYPEPSLRPMADLDVLVPYEQRDAALAVVQSLGYRFYTLAGPRPTSSGDNRLLKRTHHYHLKGGIADKVILELHFRLLGCDVTLLPVERLAWFWSRAETLETDGSWPMTVPQPEAHLLYLAAHAILQHGEAQVYLLRYFDLHLLITRNEVDWDRVVEQAVTWGWTLAVERALRRTVEFFATPVPESVFDALVKRRPDCEDTSRVIRLQGPGHRWEHLRVGLAGLSRRERLQVVSEILFPTPAYMRQRYRIRPGWPSWPYYAYRWVDQGREVVAALRRRVSGWR